MLPENTSATLHKGYHFYAREVFDFQEATSQIEDLGGSQSSYFIYPTHRELHRMNVLDLKSE